MRQRYAAALRYSPQVLLGLSKSWKSLVHKIQHATVTSVAFSPDSSHLASVSNKILRIWTTASGELARELEGHTRSVKSEAFSDSGRFIVSGSRDTTVRVWDMTSWKTAQLLTGHMDGVTCVAISRNDMFVVSGSKDGTVRTWTK